MISIQLHFCYIHYYILSVSTDQVPDPTHNHSKYINVMLNNYLLTFYTSNVLHFDLLFLSVRDLKKEPLGAALSYFIVIFFEVPANELHTG